MQTSPASVFWPVFFACIGGAFVLAGLLLETFSDKKWFKNLDSFRRWKSLKHCGEWLVIAGIVIEIVDAGVTALQIRQADKNINAADPRNQPINSISGYAIVEVRAKGDREIELAKNSHQILMGPSINFDTTPSTRMRQNPESVELIFSRFPTESPSGPNGSDIVAVGWINSLNTVVDDSKPYIPNLCFVLQFSVSGLWNPDAVTFNELKYVQIMGLGNAGEVQPPLEIIGGKIELKINLDWPKEFSIPKQTNQFWRVSSFETNRAFIPAGYGLVTNSASAGK